MSQSHKPANGVSGRVWINPHFHFSGPDSSAPRNEPHLGSFDQTRIPEPDGIPPASKKSAGKKTKAAAAGVHHSSGKVEPYFETK
jgi:hypothetical protein